MIGGIGGLRNLVALAGDFQAAGLAGWQGPAGQKVIVVKRPNPGPTRRLVLQPWSPQAAGLLAGTCWPES